MNGTKGTALLSEDELQIESMRDGITKVRCTYRLRAYLIQYAVIFGRCEDVYGRITVRLLCHCVITGRGQMQRLITKLHEKGLLIKHEPKDGKRGIYYTLSELGRNVRALYLATYRERYSRLVKHIAKHSAV